MAFGAFSGRMMMTALVGSFSRAHGLGRLVKEAGCCYVLLWVLFSCAKGNLPLPCKHEHSTGPFRRSHRPASPPPLPSMPWTAHALVPPWRLQCPVVRLSSFLAPHTIPPQPTA